MYKRILLKLSGESLGGKSAKGLDINKLSEYAKAVAQVHAQGVQIAIVVGGGNIFRGMQGVDGGFDRVDGDKMGMLATVINSMALARFIKKQGVDAQVFTATPMQPIARYYNRDEALNAMQNNSVVLVAGGTGNPFFTTDSGAALRALELEVDILLKGTRVDGIYTADPEKDPNASKYDNLTYSKAIEDGLKIMDQSAFSLCRDANMPILVFNMDKEGNLLKLINGEQIGTLVKETNK